MKYIWLNKKNNNKLILFFNGWGMDSNIVNHLEYEDYDVLMFYNYNNLDCEIEYKHISQYQERILISWSMGVMIASLFDELNYTYKIAVNGTLKPIDKTFGILPKIYDLTIKGFNEINREKFIKNMFDNNTATNSLHSERSIQDQHSELIAIKNYKANLNFKYDKIFISNNDKIIPTKSQTEFWEQNTNLNSGHCPFLKFNKWSDFL